eukprot:TRINITY_DN38803_c0_g1_i1.p1 TRINITY_DN38803_c0_g1~~TRINITY_DN38803_c0_g1_i1.p1  ORF type:complete len:353 (+),score=64.49 TRINITY_DN38803_c0_g1_i1:41-1099(+)
MVSALASLRVMAAGRHHYLLRVFAAMLVPSLAKRIFAPGKSETQSFNPVKTQRDFLHYGQEILLVGCACKMNFCREGTGLHIRDTTIPLYPGPLSPGDPKWAPTEEDCPVPAAGEERGAEGAVSKDVENYLDAGTGATARVVFMKANRYGQVLSGFIGEPMREGQMAAVIAAEDFQAGITDKALTTVVVQLPFRQPYHEELFDSQVISNGPEFKDRSIVEFSNSLLSNYWCVVMKKNPERCFKYGKLADVFHFRALAMEAAPVVAPVKSSKTVAEMVKGIAKEDCAAVVSGSTIRKGFYLGKYKCKCPKGSFIGGTQSICEERAKEKSEDGKGVKFAAADFSDLHCKCSSGS